MAGLVEVSVEVSELTDDALLRGRLPLLQPKRGARTNVDALWLASFARAAKPSRRCLDLGCGVGAVGLACIVLGAARAATLLDVDASLVELAKENARRAGLDARVETIVADVRVDIAAPLAHAFDLVVANPPYFSEGSSRPAKDASRARARIAPADLLSCFARTARASLGAAGRACFVFPARELERLFVAVRATGLEPKRMRLVHPLPDAPASVVLLEAKPARPGGLRVEPPLVVMHRPGAWTDDARAILEPT